MFGLAQKCSGIWMIKQIGNIGEAEGNDVCCDAIMKTKRKTELQMQSRIPSSLAVTSFRMNESGKGELGNREESGDLLRLLKGFTFLLLCWFASLTQM